MIRVKTYRKSILYVVVIIFSLAISSCKIKQTPKPSYLRGKIDTIFQKSVQEKFTVTILRSKPVFITKNSLKLKAKYPDLLVPILPLK
jgi:hypothetical protein